MDAFTPVSLNNTSKTFASVRPSHTETIDLPIEEEAPSGGAGGTSYCVIV